MAVDSRKQLNVEALEPRILYSAAPVEAPAEAEAATEAPEQVVASAPQAAPDAPTATPQAVVPADAEVAPANDGETTIAADQGVTLVDLSAQDAASGPLTQESLEAVADAARQRWIDSGISDEQLAVLDSVDYSIADLDSDRLGSVQGLSIQIDRDAAGSSWFVDTTPAGDSEFLELTSAGYSIALPDGSAEGTVDLLSVLLHEQGHLLGVEHSQSGLMADFINEGQRRLPMVGQADGAVAGPVSEAAFIKLNDTPVAGGDVHEFQISADSSRVVYRATGDTFAVNELYSRAIDGSGSEVKLNDPLVAGGDVLEFQISADSSRVVYLADGDTGSVNELYSRLIDGSGSVVKLNDALPANGTVHDFQISADSSRVVYSAEGDTNNEVELYSRLIDGGGSEIKLNNALPPGGDVTDFQISADSSRIVYIASADTEDVYELYSSLIDVAGTQIKLSAPLPSGGDVITFQISADSSRVVYNAEGDADFRYELYSRAIDGSGSEVKLNDTLVSGGDVFEFQISADSSRVVYTADGDTNGVNELYSRAIDGSGSEVELNNALPSGGQVGEFQISADSSRVVYTADGDTDDVTELYSRAIDGSGSVVKLNDALPAGGNVNSFQISADSSRVVYTADGDTDDVTELYSRAIDGSGSEVKLNDALPAGGNVDSFQISADSNHVIYRTDGDTDDVNELYRRAIDGSGSEVKLNDVLAVNGEVSVDFQISADSNRVVYIADGDNNSVNELYSVLANPAVAPDSTSITIDGAGNLVITDTEGTKQNQYLLTSDGITLTIKDESGENIGLGAVSGGGTGTDTVTVILSAWTGAIIVNSAGGDDSLEIDYSSGSDFDGRAITFNGETHDSTNPGDQLILTGGTFASAEYNYTNASNGSIQLSGQGLISYTGLEPITNSGTVTDVIFNLPATGDVATLTDNGSNLTLSSGGTFELTTFNKPTGSLTINGGAGADSLTLSNVIDLSATNTDIVFNLETIHLNGSAVALGAGDLTFNGAVSLGAAALTVTGADVVFASTIRLGANDLTISVTGADSEIAGEISGRGGLVKEGAGTLALNNATGNTYTGDTTVNAGTLLANNTSGSATGAPTGSIVATFDWAVSGGGINFDAGQGVQVDSIGNSLVTGYFQGSATFGSTTLTSVSGTDRFIAKLDSSGNYLWAVRAGGSSNLDLEQKVAVDDSGNVYVTGSFNGSETFGSTTLTSAGVNDSFVAKLDSSGNYQWAVSGGGSGEDSGLGVAVDESGNSFVTGTYHGSATFGSTTLASAGDSDSFIAKLDSSGNYQWAISGGGIGEDSGLAVAADGNGNTFVTGFYNGSATFGPTTLTSVGASDSFAAKISAAVAGAITVNANGTLGGTGFIASDITSNGGTIAPGLNTGADTSDDLGSGSFNLTSDSTITIELGGTTGNTGYDQLDVTGTVNINSDANVSGGALLQLSVLNGFTPTISDTFRIIDNDDTDAISGATFRYDTGSGGIIELTEGTSFAADGQVFSISYAAGDDSNDIVLTALGAAVVAETEVSIDASGNLVITDINGGVSDDALTIVDEGASYLISDASLVLTTSLAPADAQQVDANTIRVFKTAITGGLIVETLGDDISNAATDVVTFGGSNPIIFAGDIVVNATAESAVLNQNVTSTGGDVTFSGAVTVGAAAVTVTGADVVFASTIDLDANDLTVSVTGADSQIAGEISGSGTLVKDGAGTLALNNATGNTYTGTTTVNDGALLANNTSGSATGPALLGPGNWTQLGQDIAGENAGDRLGGFDPPSSALSSNGRTMVVGSRFNDGNGADSGHVRIYDWNATTMQWEQRGMDIDGEAAGDLSGESVSMSGDGNSVIIGARFNDNANGLSAGHARIYDWNATTTQWEQRGMDIDGEAGGNGSGSSVSMSSDGNSVIIGAPGNDNTNGANAGHARIYDWNATTTQWEQRGMDIDGEAAGDGSGSSVSMSGDGNTVIIGAHFNSGNGTASGHARIYDWNATTTQWEQRGMDIDGEAAGDASGLSTSISDDGNTVIIGAPSNNANGADSGHARIYDWNATTTQWEQRGMDIDGAATGKIFGYTVSMSADGNIVIIGDPEHDNGIANESGQTQIYQWNATAMEWQQRGMDINGDAAGDLFGYSIAMSSDGNTVIINAPESDSNGTDSGHARVYQFNAGLPVGSVTINANGTLGGTGFIASDIISNGGTIAPGLNTGGDTTDDLGSGNLSLTSNSTFTIELGGTTENTDYDQLDVTGTVNINFDANIGGGALLNLSVLSGFTPAVNDTFRIVNNDDTDAITAATFRFDTGSGIIELTEGNTFTVDNQIFSISYLAGDDSNDIVLTALGAVAVEETEVSIDASGNLVITDINGGVSDDALTIIDEGASYLISDANLVLITSLAPADAQQVDAYSIRVFKTAVSGGLIVETLGDDASNAATDVFTFGGSNPIIFAGDIVVNATTESTVLNQNVTSTGGNVTFNGAVTLGAAAVTITGTDVVFASTIDLEANQLTMSVTGTDSQIAGEISGSGALVKNGVGTLALNNATGSSYTGGTTVNDGTLLASNTSGSATGPAASSDPPNWTQIGQDIDGENRGDRLGGDSGVALSADGRTMVVGAAKNDGSGSNSGHVRIYDWNDTEWVQRGLDIDGEASGDSFGYSVSMSSNGDTVIIGAPLNDGNGNASGHARIYDWNTSTNAWEQRGQDIDGEAALNLFGSSVSMSGDGNTVIVGAPHNNGNGGYSGHARIYDWNASTNAWEQRGQDIDGEAALNFSGSSVSMSNDGNTVIIGAPFNKSGAFDRVKAGHARIYDWNASTSLWQQRGQDINGESHNDRSGESVSISDDGNTVVIGARLNDGTASNSGHARIYDWNATTTRWDKRGLDIDGEAGNDYFGSSVSMSGDGNTVVIGAPGNDGNGNASGHVQIHDWNATTMTWQQRGTNIEGEAARDGSGLVAISGDGSTVIIGAPENDGNGRDSGHARVYRFAPAISGDPVTIQSNGTLGGTGFIASDIIANGGTIAPGLNTGADTSDDLGSGDLSLTSNSTFTVELGGTTENTDYDQLDVTGTVNLNTDVNAGGGALLNLSLLSGFTPAVNDTFRIVDNDGTDAVTGATFRFDTGSGIVELTEGTSFTVNDQIFSISYIGSDDHNDIVLTAQGIAETSVELNGTTLEVRDINGGTSDDGLRISIDAVNMRLIIEDPDHTITTSIGGAARPSAYRVEIALSAFRDVDIQSLAGDDLISIDGLTGITGSFAIDGGNDFDQIVYNAVAAAGTLTGASTYTANAEQITHSLGSTLSTDSGAITLTGVGGGRSSISGVSLTGATLQSASGPITMTGQSGEGGAGNSGVSIESDRRSSTASTVISGGQITLAGSASGIASRGVTIDRSSVSSTGAVGGIDIDGTSSGTRGTSAGSFLYEASLSTNGGDLNVDGTGTGNASANSRNSSGVNIQAGSILTAGGNGQLNITGTGTDGRSNNNGIFLNRNVSLTVDDGNLTLTGNGGSGTGSANKGILMQDESQLLSTGDGNITLTGTGRASGSDNKGIHLIDGRISSTGNGTITLNGQGSDNGRGGTVGVRLDGNPISSAKGAINIVGASGANTTGRGNTGVQLVNGAGIAVTDGSGAITITGTGGDGTETNEGVWIHDSNMYSIDGNITIVGTGGGGTNLNRGLHVYRSEFRPREADLTLQGIAQSTTTGSRNDGIFLQQAAVTSSEGTLNVAGTGGGGTSRNNGIHSFNSNVGASGSSTIVGLARSNTTGSYNNGIYAGTSSNSGGLSGRTLRLTGTGGGGTSNNHGISMANIRTTTSSSTIIEGQARSSTSGGNNNGIDLHATSIRTHGLNLTGTGGGGTNSNTGISMRNSSAVAENAFIVIDGGAHGNTVGAYNIGINFLNSSLVAGSFSIEGTGGNGTDYNRGIYMRSTSLEAIGNVNIVGQGLTSTSGAANIGIDIANSSIASTFVDINIDGTSGNGTSRNVGINMINSSAQATAGDTNIIGQARANTNSSILNTLNTGVYLLDSTLEGENVDITGTGAIGAGSSRGIHMIRSSAVATFSLARLTGTASQSTINTFNTGVFLRNSSLEGAFLDITGNGGGGEKSRGIHMIGSSALATVGSATLTGTALHDTTGTRNHGVFLLNSTLEGATLDITGTSGGGTSYNEGVRIFGGSAIANAGSARFTGTAFAGTTGSYNVGVSLNSIWLRSNYSAIVTGTGGGGRAQGFRDNFGIYMHHINGTDNAVTDGNATDGNSADEAGNFFP